jgi:hypothetical protein
MTLDHFDWHAAEEKLEAKGFAILPKLLQPDDCAQLAGGFDDDEPFRSHIQMARHNFGKGEYKYWRYPLPPLVQKLRESLYRKLAPIANRWGERLKSNKTYPSSLIDYLEQCHSGGQCRPTPLLLRYGKGDYNCLHQDLYGDQIFPIQVIIMLDQQARDYQGGELLLIEQRPRMQSIGRAITPNQGDAVIIATHHRPQKGVRGDYRVTMKHGVSEIISGGRRTLGIIFHDGA